MHAPKGTLQEGITRQRDALKQMLAEPLTRIAAATSYVWHDRAALETALLEGFAQLPACKFLYALDTDAIQLCSTVGRDGLIPEDFQRDRSRRPYMRERVPADGFLLSQAYSSLRAKRPSLTAVQLVRGSDWRVLGFIGADFDLRDLPLTRQLYEEPKYWRQVKGDPAIRGTVFHQTRSESQMDQHIDTVLGVMSELIAEHGIFHGKLHFSSSRGTIWLYSDPYRYRLLDIDALIDPNICLAYPTMPYPADAVVPQDKVQPVLEGLKKLRFMDDMFYLRSGSLNIFNGMVGLTFSCDGSHYVPYDEFLAKGYEFWVSGAGLSAT